MKKYDAKKQDKKQFQQKKVPAAPVKKNDGEIDEKNLKGFQGGHAGGAVG